MMIPVRFGVCVNSSMIPEVRQPGIGSPPIPTQVIWPTP